MRLDIKEMANIISLADAKKHYCNSSTGDYSLKKRGKDWIELPSVTEEELICAFISQSKIPGLKEYIEPSIGTTNFRSVLEAANYQFHLWESLPQFEITYCIPLAIRWCEEQRADYVIRPSLTCINVPKSNPYVTVGIDSLVNVILTIQKDECLFFDRILGIYRTKRGHEDVMLPCVDEEKVTEDFIAKYYHYACGAPESIIQQINKDKNWEVYRYSYCKEIAIGWCDKYNINWMNERNDML